MSFLGIKRLNEDGYEDKLNDCINQRNLIDFIENERVKEEKLEDKQTSLDGTETVDDMFDTSLKEIHTNDNKLSLL